MTPRHADIAFVLEGVPGVREVYALDTQSAGDLTFAVRLEHGGRHVAAAHYALLRVLTHDECKAVLFFEVDLPPAFRERALRLGLSPDDRDAARARVPVSSAALEQPPAPAAPAAPIISVDFHALIVDADPDVHRAIVTALDGDGFRAVVEADPIEAFRRARERHFSLIVCDARLAFGGNGFLRMLHASDPTSASRVLLVAHEGERDLLLRSLDELHCWTSFVCRPVDVETLLEILLTGSIIQRWRIPILSPRTPSEPKSTTKRVLVVDDDPTSAMLLASSRGSAIETTVTFDEWEALDAIAPSAPVLVVCSVSLRTRGGVPFYRLLWNAHPELKRRFVFIASADSAPASTTTGRGAPVVERPLTREVIAKLVERFTEG
jgi:CheY-like chemotaxis protein